MFYFFVVVFSMVFTLIIKKYAVKLQILDVPDGHLKTQAQAVPLLGGAAIFAAFWLVVGYLFACTNLLGKNTRPEQWLMIFVATALLLVAGYVDDRRRLSPAVRLLTTIFCAMLVVAAGVSINKITNPFGGVLRLGEWQLLGWAAGEWLAKIVAVVWLTGMTYTTKISDGLDGLTAGVTAIGALVIYLLSASAAFYQPDVALLALVFAGACLGFLVFNFPPAKIFLGEGGSQFLGFILGTLAIAAGGKIATALLVMAVPILDLARVIYLRLRRGAPVFDGDRRHLHFALLRLGLSARQAVLLYYCLAFSFGVTTLILQSWQKLLALSVLALGMVAVSAGFLNDNQ